MQEVYEQGEALYFGGRYAEAVALLRRAAEGGHVHAAFQLGRCFEELGRSREAVHWLRVAAERGDTLAMNELHPRTRHPAPDVYETKLDVDVTPLREQDLPADGFSSTAA